MSANDVSLVLLFSLIMGVCALVGLIVALVIVWHQHHRISDLTDMLHAADNDPSYIEMVKGLSNSISPAVFNSVLAFLKFGGTLTTNPDLQKLDAEAETFVGKIAPDGTNPNAINLGQLLIGLLNHQHTIPDIPSTGQATTTSTPATPPNVIIAPPPQPDSTVQQPAPQTVVVSS